MGHGKLAASAEQLDARDAIDRFRQPGPQPVVNQGKKLVNPGLVDPSTVVPRLMATTPFPSPDLFINDGVRVKRGRNAGRGGPGRRRPEPAG